MQPTYEFPELPVLHGALMTRLSEDEFFELCQANPTLNFERNSQQEIIIMPLPVLTLVSLVPKAKGSFGIGIAKIN